MPMDEQSMTATDDGSPGSHLRNWRPGDDDAEELQEQKIRDAYRNGVSDRQLAKLIGWTRKQIWQARLYAAIPDGLFDRLLEAQPPVGTKALTWIGRFCDTGETPPIEWECCPNCGHKLRARSEKGIRRALDILSKWIEDGRPEANNQGDRDA
jgi:hypothetical protein